MKNAYNIMKNGNMTDEQMNWGGGWDMKSMQGSQLLVLIENVM